jgi:hypothetical protein
MNTKEWAGLLTGREYCEELTHPEEKAAKEDGIVIVFGASDDLLEFRGAIDDEVFAWRGTKVRLTPKPGVLDEDSNSETLEYNRMQIAGMRTISAIWCPKNEKGEVWASWEIKTDIPHETFDIMEDGERYCRGLVFDAKWLTMEHL